MVKAWMGGGKRKVRWRWRWEVGVRGGKWEVREEVGVEVQVGGVMWKWVCGWVGSLVCGRVGRCMGWWWMKDLKKNLVKELN